jgi:hypothetical protein
MTYGTAEHEAWLIEREREDERWAGVADQPTRAEVREVLGGCGCLVSMVYGGDCEHTAAGELEGERA